MSDRFTKTDLEKAKEAAKRIKDKRAEKRMKNSRPEKKGSSITDIFKSYGKYDGKPIELKGGGMSAGQKKIAAKAPPPNKIDEKDFKVLREEKAKGRGMGLQDESIKPGKVMKANKGKSAMVPLKKGYSKTLGVFPTINKVKPSVGGSGSGSGMGKGTDKVSTKKAEDFMKRRKKLTGSKLPGRIGTALGAVSMLVPAAYAAAKQYKDYKSAKNRDKAKVKKMGGGMIGPSQRPGYSKGTMVKARGCKLGRTRPTKIT